MASCIGCAGSKSEQSRSPDRVQEDLDAAMVALRRENEALLRENELLRDKQLMCAGPRQAAMAPKAAIKLVPEGQGPSEPKVSRGVSLQDLPHSAPDPSVMERYSASAAPSELQGSAHPDPKRYRIVGGQRSRGQAKRSKASGPSTQPASAKALYAKARRLYVDGQRLKARRLFRAIEQDYPGSDLADNAIYWQAEDDRDAGRIKQAQAGFMRILSDYPAGNKVEDAMFMLGLCFKDRLAFGQARDMLRKVVSLGRKELADKARHELALIGKLESTDDSMNGR